MTDTSFAERLGAHRVVAGAIQQSLADRASIHVTQVHRYEAGSSSQPTLDVLRSLTQSISAASLPFGDDGHGPNTPGLRLKLQAFDRLDSEQARSTTLIEVRFPPGRGGIDNEDRDAREAKEVRPGVP